MEKNKPFGEGYSHSLKKTLLIMRIAIILFILGILQANATDAYSRKTKFSKNFSDEKLISDRKIILAHDYLTSEPQQKQITGTVTDEKRTPLGGVTVLVKGTTTGALTDASGKYSLNNVPPNATLIYSFVGMTTQEVPSEGRILIDVVLKEAAIGLDEIVVIGYGTIKKNDLTGSVATIAIDEIKALPVSSVDQRMVGQSPGVSITMPTGTPGGGASIRIRGDGSIGAGNDPLFVIDGFPVTSSFGQRSNPLNMIDPADIESITVLKDASSTAIYGSRGSNGVVIITTKKGVSGTPKVEISTYVGRQVVPQKGRPQVLNGTEYATYQREYIYDTRAFQGLTTTEADYPEYLHNPEQYGKGTNWYDVGLRKAWQNSINASVNGGSQNSRYSLSLGRVKQDGVVRYTDYERFSARLSLESNLGKKLKIGLMLAPTKTVQHLSDVESSTRDTYVVRSVWMSPLSNVYDETGKRVPFVYYRTPEGNIINGGRPAPNLLNSLEYAGTLQNVLRGLGNVYAEYEIINGLKAKYSFNVDYSTGDSKLFNRSFVGAINIPPPVVPTSTITNFSTFNWLSEALLSYNKVINEDHNIDAVFGYNAQHESSEDISNTAYGYPDDLVETINASTLIQSWGQSINEWSLVSYLARVNYSYKGKYIITATYRADGSSRFGPNERFGYFPSAALGWKASDENFLKGISWINNLKFRTSYGLAGNYNIGNYTWIQNIGSSNYVFGTTVAPGRSISSMSNLSLTWEKSNQFDAGLDLGLFKDRIFFTADFYNRITNDMLLNNEIALSSGFSTSIFNLGKIRNRGFEFSIISRNVEKEFTWSTSGNISFNRNVVLALGTDNKPIYAGRSGEGAYTHKTEVGKPMGQFFGYMQLGIYTDAQDLANSPHNTTSVVGSIKYADIDGNGLIEQNLDGTVLGNYQPYFTYGITNNFGYKKFNLNVIMVGNYGGKIMRSLNQTFWNNEGGSYPGQFNIDRNYVLNRWRSPEQPGNGLCPGTNGGRVNARDVHNKWVEDASYLRIQNVTLSYTLAPKILNIESANFYISCQNLAIWTPYSLGNPDAMRAWSAVSGQSLSLTPAEDFGNYPLARSVNVGLNLTF